MDQRQIIAEIDELERELVEKKKRINELRSKLQGKRVENYIFQGVDEEVSLLELFGDKDELIVIHNMGKSCPYCTLWADGFNGIYHHIIEKAAFVLTSPDSPAVQEDLAAERGWVFPILSTCNNSFKEDLGYRKGGENYPGVSVLTKDQEGNIYHHTEADFGPGDEYCVLWSLFDLLPSGYADFQPQKKISKSPFQLTNNIAVQVRDYNDALEFYENVLGFELVETYENETQFRVGKINLFVEDEPEETNTFFEFAVDNLQRVKLRLQDEGCEIIEEYSDKSIMIEDPYGLYFHIFEPE